MFASREVTKAGHPTEPRLTVDYEQTPGIDDPDLERVRAPLPDRTGACLVMY